MGTIYDSILAAEECDAIDALRVVVREQVQAHGYDRIVVFSGSAAFDDLLDGIYWIEGEWYERDEAPNAETYIRHCPVTRHILETDEPFFWTKTSAHTGARYRFVQVPRGAGLHGLQVPVFGRGGLIGAVTFGGERIDASAKVRLGLTQLGVTTFLAARKLLESSEPTIGATLSGRELEVLRWIASGRRVADVAATLGRSERTVENHLRRIRHRLRVKTTAQAITAALRSGAIRA